MLEATAALINTYFNPAQTIGPDDVVITTGASLCLDALMFTLCDEGDEVLITAPYWSQCPCDHLSVILTLSLSRLVSRREVVELIRFTTA